LSSPHLHSFPTRRSSDLPSIADASAVSVEKDVVIAESAITDSHCPSGVDSTAQTRPFGGAPEHRVVTDRTVADYTPSVYTTYCARKGIHAPYRPGVHDRSGTREAA